MSCAVWHGENAPLGGRSRFGARPCSGLRPVHDRSPDRATGSLQTDGERSLDVTNYECLDGNEAAARVAYALSEVISIYPITPASPMAEHCDDWSAAGRPNLWGKVPDVVEMRSEAGAAGASTARSRRARWPRRSLPAGPPLDDPEHVQDCRRADAGRDSCRRADHCHACPVDLRRPQRRHARADDRLGDARGGISPGGHDFALVAHAATLGARIPFLHFFDGFRTSMRSTRSRCSSRRPPSAGPR